MYPLPPTQTAILASNHNTTTADNNNAAAAAGAGAGGESDLRISVGVARARRRGGNAMFNSGGSDGLSERRDAVEGALDARTKLSLGVDGMDELRAAQELFEEKQRQREAAT
eukprot:COSAG06_NODE_32947_length_497_cov_2.597990_1_plen_111_part_10